jgi:uncharacterized RDD family membrane protein YckC
MERNDKRHSGLADAAGRAAFFPARAAARAWRDQLETAADQVLSAPEITRVIDRALAGCLPEEIARSIVRHRTLERVVVELASSGELERLLNAAVSSPQTLKLTDRVLASDETQLMLQHVASSPELREAVTKQTTGLADEVIGGGRDSAERLDNRLERSIRRRRRHEHPVYAGIVTRGLAFATDAILLNLLYMSMIGVIALVSSLLGGLNLDWVIGTILASGWALLATVYFVFFWSTAGQTPGMCLLGLRVQKAAGGGPPSPGLSIVRLIGLVLSIAVIFLGFVPILFTRRRRGVADFLAGTVVPYDDGERPEHWARPARGTRYQTR